METYKSEACKCCGQSKTYAIAIDQGTVEILKQIAKFIGTKGINCVHPRKEMEGTYFSSNQVGNLSRPRLHGLIAHVRDNPGNYLLTTKGAQFLKGREIPRVAIVLKATEKSEVSNIGYFDAENDVCTVQDFQGNGGYWEGVGYSISEGRIVRDEMVQTTMF